MLYSELVNGRRKRGRPTSRFKDVCKRDLKSLHFDTDKWEEFANDRDKWRSSVYEILKEREKQFLRNLSRRRIHSRMSLFYLFISFLSHDCVCFILVYCIFSICIYLFFSLSTITHRLTAGLLTLSSFFKYLNIFLK